jgi:hypothetical protein
MVTEALRSILQPSIAWDDCAPYIDWLQKTLLEQNTLYDYGSSRFALGEIKTAILDTPQDRQRYGMNRS